MAGVAIQKATNLLTTSWLLAHYDPDLPMKITADVSAYGIGASSPIFYQMVWKNQLPYYALIEKEALALEHGVM